MIDNERDGHPAVLAVENWLNLFSIELNRRLKDRGTKTKLAEFTRKSPALVTKWLAGDTAPSMEDLELIAKFFRQQEYISSSQAYDNSLQYWVTIADVARAQIFGSPYVTKIQTVGGRRLVGDIRLSGSKDTTLALLAAAVLPKHGRTVLTNVPRNSDVFTLMDILRSVNVQADFTAPDTITIDSTAPISRNVPYELVRKMRASFSVLGPLLARFGAASIALPGGCDIGARPVNYHIKGLERMGALVTVSHGVVEAATPRGLHGANIYLDRSSVGATIHLMTAAALAEGVTTISNAAQEPDVVATAGIINMMGGKVRGAGTKEITIEGVKALHGTEYTVDTDRIEAGTFAVAAAITHGDLFIRGAIKEHVQPITRKLVEAGATVVFSEDGVRVRVANSRTLSAISIRSSPYPGFPTDMQPQFAAMLTLATGTSVITETLFERRFRYINELARMGATIKTEANAAIIEGVTCLTGTSVDGSDLRATAALVLAGLAAEGQSEISGIHYLNRGYENFVGKLRSVGANIRQTDEKSPMLGR